jgi:hypothetical protein
MKTVSVDIQESILKINSYKRGFHPKKNWYV